jgi:transposase
LQHEGLLKLSLEGGAMQRERGHEYSQDLRDRVLAAEGSVADVGRRFGVSPSYVSRVRMRRDGEGLCTTKARGAPRAPRLTELRQALLEQVARAPDQTLAQLCQWAAERGVQVSKVTMHNSLKRWGLTLKKRLSMRASSSA